MNAMQQLLTEHMEIWTAADTEKKSGRGRASGNAGSVYGIKKLRELILELAVRGKLVPQDANDEPASELLKRIQAEKAKFVAEGKIKKEKPPASIGENQKPFELPLGWEWVSLNEVADVIRGVTYGKSDASDNPINDYVPLLRGNNIDRVLNFDKPVYVPSKLLNESQFVKKGDIVIAMSSGSADLVGKAAQAEIDFNGGFGAFCGVVRSFSSELLSYFSYFFQTPYYRNTVAGYGKGIGINNLQKSSLVLLYLPIPPLAEQHRIVAKVDELMALCDQLEAQHSNAAEAHEKLVSHLLDTLTQSQGADDFSANWQRIAAHFDTLFTTEASIDTLKQTLLQLAVMGKLVPQDTNDEPASELLKRIQAEKAQLVAKGAIKKDKSLEPITREEKPLELPNGWEWVKCQDACIKITDGEHATPNRSQSGFYLLSARNITNDGIILDDVDYVPLEEFSRIRNRCDPNIGDILISCSGSVGRVALVDKNDAYSMVRSAAMIRPNKNWLFNKYIALLLRSTYLQNQMKSRSKQSAQANLFLGAISNLVFIIPPLAEQHRIVAKFDELVTLCDQLKTRITEASRRQQQLADVMIERAIHS